MPPGPAKTIGNGLRELDRFLSLLIDEVAAAVAPAGLDQARFAGLRNTPNKLRTIRAAMALPSPDHERLSAIGRARECLFHCAPMPRRGGPAAAPARLALVDRLTPGEDALRDLCRFYDAVAADLLAAHAAHVRGRDRPDTGRNDLPLNGLGTATIWRNATCRATPKSKRSSGRS